MQWIDRYQLFLFDLDGLLVNTEELHYRAYRDMLANRGYTIPWDFAAYFQIAQMDADAPRRAIYSAFAELEKEEPSWQVLYAEKKEAYRRILEREPAPLLPGVERLLRLLKEKNVRRATVTHTSRALVDLIRRQNPVLNTITHWFCREDYNLPKPSPDGYLKAIQMLSKPGDAIIGFEDSFRGLQSLIDSGVTPVLVNSIDPALRKTCRDKGIQTYSSFEEV